MKTKKLLSLLLTLCMLLSVVPMMGISVSAEGTDYVCPNCGATTAEDFNVDEYDGGHDAWCDNCDFSCCSECSYAECTTCHPPEAELEYQIIDKDNKYASVYAKEGCKPFKGELVIPSTCTIEGETYKVTEISEMCFYAQSQITSVVISDGVKSIANSAFWACSSLKSVTIPDSVTTIGDSAFQDCYSLESVKIPDGVTTISRLAFALCTSLTSVTIPDSVTTIGGSAFQDCSSLKSVTIPDSVTTIGDTAFSNCTSLTSVTIPAGVTSIGKFSFSKVSLDNVTFETDNVNSIAVQSNSFATTLPTTQTGSATVKIYGYHSNTEINGNVRNGQLLKPVLEGYTGSTELYYQFRTDNSDANNAVTFNTSDMTTNGSYSKSGTSSVYFFKNEAYAAIVAGKTPTSITCNVYEPVLTEGKLSFNLIATKTYSNPMGNGDDTAMLSGEFSDNNVLLMHEGDGATSLKQILNKAGFTHLDCSNVHFDSVTLASGTSVTVDGTDKTAAITPVATGLSKITFTCYTTECFYHGTAGTQAKPVTGAVYIYVAGNPTLTSTTDSITVTDNTTSPATSTYRIGLTNTGTVNGKATTFTGLNSETEYDVIQELNLTIDKKDYIGYYHNYITTEAFDPVCYIDADNSSSFNNGDTEYATLTAALAAAKPADEDEDNPTVIRMIADSTENITIASDRFITLDLNGHVLEGDGDASVITVKGKLSVIDNNPTNAHYFTDSNSDDWYEAYTDTEPGSGSYTTITGGCITGGKADTGGGIYVCDGAELTMTGGNIFQNITNDNCSGIGGGIYIDGMGKVTLNNVTLSNNKARHGGAVGTDSFANLLINGCSVKNNTATFSGGGIYKPGLIKKYEDDTAYGKCIILNSTITDNTAGTGGGVYFQKTNSSCFVAGTLVSMADGTTKKVEDVVEGDMVKTFNHESGEFSSAKVYIAFSEQAEPRQTFKLNFEDGYSVTCVNCHCFLERSTRKYETLYVGNAESYVGKYFFAEDGNWHKLESVDLNGTTEVFYEIYTAEHQNSFANGMLSLPADVDYLLNIYELDEDLKADAEQLNADISKYGLAYYEYYTDICDMTPEWYEVSSAKYIFIAIGKGLVTMDELESVSASVVAPEQNATAPAPMLVGASLLSESPTPTLSDFASSDYNGVLTIGNGTKIIGNTGNNVYLNHNDSFIYIYGTISDVNVGVTTKEKPTDSQAVRFTTNGTEADEAYFFSDNTAYADKYNESGYLELVTVFPEAVAGASYSASLTLDADIDLNFTMGGLGENFAKDKLTITVDGDTWTKYTVSDGTLSGVLKAVEPKDIGTDLHIVITYNGVTVKDFNYSVSDYCNAVYNAQGYGADSDLGKLCTALLNYGKYAQDYATGNTDSTVNESHEITFGSNYSFTGLKDEKVIPGNYAGKGSEAYLTLGSTIKLNFILKNCSEVLSTGYKENGEADKDNPQNFYVLNDKAEPEQIDPKRIKVTTDGDDTIVSIDLYASQLSTSYTLKLKGVDTSKFCITYGVYNYCSAAQGLSADDGFTDTVKTLCKAIHNYSKAVDAYIESTAQ